MTSTKRKLAAAVLALAAAGLLWACRSQAPYPVTYSINAQQKMQAVHHWDILAEDVANQVMMTIEQHPGIETQPVSVASPDETTAFSLMFHDLLVSHLVNRGLVLTPSNEGSLILGYSARILQHEDRIIRKNPVKWTMLAGSMRVARAAYDWATEDILNMGIGVGILGDLARGYTTGDKPAKELFITTTLAYGDRYLMHANDIYYINDGDWWQYDANPIAMGSSLDAGGPGQAKTYRTVSE
ncbi:hypothetical protein [Desulfatibacillum aliphaticivorans]|uniref:Lipoprotein n=1 Tax=Desulfatibacillum aliphaticivorans TaxID=218208 RepID=B8FMT3_DESAL|nr:hypothetical protein [Desulfatibacillum aliphaticivorans]ACL01950.1 conserved hypothetical protein [Desulfatibacillum aliphaticivorans]